MRDSHNAFHLAVPVRDLDEAQEYYVAGLGCHLARRYDDRITLDFFGDQVVCHLSSEWTPATDLYPRHFGVTFRDRSEFDAVLYLVECRDLAVFAGLQTRFKDRPEEHLTFVVVDPSGNLIEFKWYRDPPDDVLTARLVVVRHGRTVWNAQGRYQGQSDPPLDDFGRLQAALLGRAMRSLRPVAIVASDLRAARDTAAALAVGTGLAVVCDAGLREVSLGAWEGLDRVSVAASFPAELAAWEAGEDVRRGGGETLREAGARAAASLAAAVSDLGSCDTAVVVSHGLVLQHALLGLGVADAPHLDNAEAMWLRVPGGGFRLAA